jgi:hypothetical protein
MLNSLSLEEEFEAIVARAYATDATEADVLALLLAGVRGCLADGTRGEISRVAQGLVLLLITIEQRLETLDQPLLDEATPAVAE